MEVTLAQPNQIQEFFIIVADSDKKIFSVLGPMTDDTKITEEVVLCQERGQNVNCHTPGRGQSREQIIDNYSRQFGFTYSEVMIAP